MIGMHPVSMGVGLVYAMKMVSNPSLGLLLFGGTFAADLVFWRGLDSLGYLNALFIGLLF